MKVKEINFDYEYIYVCFLNKVFDDFKKYANKVFPSSKVLIKKLEKVKEFNKISDILVFTQSFEKLYNKYNSEEGIIYTQNILDDLRNFLINYKTYYSILKHASIQVKMHNILKNAKELRMFCNLLAAIFKLQVEEVLVEFDNIKEEYKIDFPFNEINKKLMEYDSTIDLWKFYDIFESSNNLFFDYIELIDSYDIKMKDQSFLKKIHNNGSYARMYSSYKILYYYAIFSYKLSYLAQLSLNKNISNEEIEQISKDLVFFETNIEDINRFTHNIENCKYVCPVHGFDNYLNVTGDLYTSFTGEDWSLDEDFFSFFKNNFN
ncbi:hypothetical protein SHELI_v1c06510 [Spiroplasma helicoides]|uniref:Uncharacterized protein n=1 Tax=Spiroplasma helicoides TaxID=216938 RepID=A0A1B3SKY9_9MOLU|nr:hypothetical protein [Spiroplasma helicoides]AOG60602.1 hypothetical protein SHELI_v1c06510 [Spiroplasma helicoides]